MQTGENILYHELIGLKIKICQCPQSDFINLVGHIIFETKNMLVIKTSYGVKKIAKSIIYKAIIYLHRNACFISGNLLIGRPEDRILKIKR
jgi:ribonuclease P protein subunit POP4